MAKGYDITSVYDGCEDRDVRPIIPPRATQARRCVSRGVGWVGNRSFLEGTATCLASLLKSVPSSANGAFRLTSAGLPRQSGRLKNRSVASATTTISVLASSPQPTQSGTGPGEASPTFVSRLAGPS